jgi:serralysin
MQIQVNNDFTTDGPFTQAQINSFLQDEQTAINILDSTFTNNITVTFDVGFGSYPGNGQILNNQTISTGDANTAAGFFLSYSQLRNDLLTFGQPGFFNAANLPAGNSINGVSNFWVSSSVGAAFGLFTNAVDGFVGIGTGFTPGAQRVSAFLHEMGHAMGRVPENNGGASSELDLWRFVSQGNRLFNGTQSPSVQNPVPAAYFSLDGGATDLADWGRTSDPSDFRGLDSTPPSNLTPNDPFNENVGTLGQLTAADIEVMERTVVPCASIP